MSAENIDYVGFLYAGLMITEDGPKVIEFNCRLGDPETQPIMVRMKGNLSEICLAAMLKELDTQTVEWDERAALGVVMASEGYPKKPRIGDLMAGYDIITGTWDTSSVTVFHAGTAMLYDKIVTNGGRVLCVVGMGDTIKEARDTAYKSVESIKWDGQFYRRDIGHRAISEDK